jgi:hypothetical protein
MEDSTALFLTTFGFSQRSSMAKRRIARQHGIRPERSHANLLAYSQLRAESQTSIKETTYCYTGTGPSPSSSPATAGEEGEGPSGPDLESSGKKKEGSRGEERETLCVCISVPEALAKSF